jgi:hypothetical protein
MHRWCRRRGRGDAAAGIETAGIETMKAGRRIFRSGIHCSVMTAQPELRTRVIVDQWVDPLIRADEWVIPETWPMTSGAATGQRTLGRSANRGGWPRFGKCTGIRDRRRGCRARASMLTPGGRALDVPRASCFPPSPVTQSGHGLRPTRCYIDTVRIVALSRCYG